MMEETTINTLMTCLNVATVIAIQYLIGKHQESMRQHRDVLREYMDATKWKDVEE